MNDWKTTVSGGFAALFPWLKTVVPIKYAPIVDALSSLSILFLGYHAAQVK